MKFIKKVAETIVRQLFGVNILLNCQLYLAQKYVLKENVYQNISGSEVKPILDSHYFKRLPYLADFFDLFENPDDFCFSRLDFAPKEVSDFESYQVDVHILEIFLIVDVILF